MPSRRDFIRTALAGAAGLAASGLFDKPPSEPPPEEPKVQEPTPEELARQQQEAQERALKEREEALNPERIREAIQAYREAFPQREEELRNMDDRSSIPKLLARVMRSEDPYYLSVAGLIGVAVLNRWKNANKGENERSFWGVVMGKAQEFGPQDQYRKFFSTDRDPTPHDEYLLLADMLVQTGEFAELYKKMIMENAEALRAQANTTRSAKSAARLRGKAQDILDNGFVIREDEEPGPGDRIGAYDRVQHEASPWWRMADRFQFLQMMFLHVAAQRKFHEEYQDKVKKGIAGGATVYRSPEDVIEKWKAELGVRMINVPLGRAGIEGEPNDYVRFGVIVGDLDKEGLSEDDFSEYIRKDVLLAACFAPPSAKRAAA